MPSSIFGLVVAVVVVVIVVVVVLQLEMFLLRTIASTVAPETSIDNCFGKRDNPRRSCAPTTPALAAVCKGASNVDELVLLATHL